MLVQQRTIKQPVSISGVGLHTGSVSTMTFKPAPENYGIRFRRIDLPGSPEVPADVDHVVDISRGTTIELGERPRPYRGTRDGRAGRAPGRQRPHRAGRERAARSATAARSRTWMRS